MLAIFQKQVAHAPQELNSPRSGAAKPKNPDQILRDFHAAHPEDAFSTSFGGGAALACVAAQPRSLSGGYQRMFCGLDDIYCVFMGSLDNLSSLMRQYGLTGRSTNEALLDHDPHDPADARNIEGGGVDGSMNELDCSTTATRMSRLGDFIRSMIREAVQVLAQGKRCLANYPSSSASNLPQTTQNVQVSTHASVGTQQDPSIPGAVTEASFAPEPRSHGDDSVEDLVMATGDDDPSKFPHFNVAQSPPDHHYFDIMDQGSSGGKKWVKTVQVEWKILKNSLPDTIYVRAFEDRMDLLRAAMVGASGTPYEDGLFFFDLQLPPSYPAVPPQVYYHSFGLRLNPNLYASGTVCLSLLNTFGGEGTEVWSPGTSSLLQVVVSIQALVLNAQPYYNEAGYETQVDTPEGHRNALPYSENTFLLTLRTALHLLRRPPKGFEEFTRDHFRRRGKYVLKRCEAYLRGCVPEEEGGMELPCSSGFRIALANMVPRLVAAFTEIGAEELDRCPLTTTQQTLV